MFEGSLFLSLKTSIPAVLKKYLPTNDNYCLAQETAENSFHD